MAKAAGEMKWDSSVARTVASPFALISSGRYSFGRRSLMTFRFVSAVSGVRFRIVSIEVSSVRSFPQSFGTMWWSSRSPYCGTVPVIQSRAPRRTSRLNTPLYTDVPRFVSRRRSRLRNRALNSPISAGSAASVVEPALQVQEVPRARGLDRAGIAVVEYAGPVPVPKLPLSVELAIGR